jgi:hypothetical protein
MTRRTLVTTRRLLLSLGACAVLVSGCGASGSSTVSIYPSTAPDETPPNLGLFLQLPVATPSACPSTVSGTTDGRASPWVGHVDVSVFVAGAATVAQRNQLGATIRANPLVRTVYFESKQQAYAEFARLYTCWTSVPRSQVPASYRVVLSETATLAERNALVQQLVNLRTVGSVSCNPTVPCTNIRRTSS